MVLENSCIFYEKKVIFDLRASYIVLLGHEISNIEKSLILKRIYNFYYMHNIRFWVIIKHVWKLISLL